MIIVNNTHVHVLLCRVYLVIFLLVTAFSVNALTPLFLDEAVHAAKKSPRKVAKKQMTNQERKDYRKKKKSLDAARKAAKTRQNAKFERLLVSYKTLDRYGMAMDKARAALKKQKASLDAAEAKTGFFKPKEKELASLRNRYNRAVDTFNSGPLKNFRDKRSDYRKQRDDYRAAKKDTGKAVDDLARHRITLDGKINQHLVRDKAARQERRGSFMNLGPGELKALNYDKIPNLNPAQHYSMPPPPAQIYGNAP